jgi:ABC-type glycerol-3-phosphate transport system substrate-binding protein
MAAGAANAQVKELRIGYQPSPIQDASIAMFETWGAKKGIKIVKVPNSYGVYVEKMTASLTSNSDQYDVIWHNDDWGQLWAHLLEPTDDIEALKYAEKWSMDKIVFGNAQGQNTVVPMGQTFSVFFYRSDLVKPEEVPKTLAELVETSKKLQAANKVKFGYVGGMAMNHSWFSWLWSMWANNCDVLAPPYERDNKKLAANGWKSMMTEPCMKETVEYWWDAINTHKISPRGMPAYDRNEANAIFMGGDAGLHRRPIRCGGAPSTIRPSRRWRARSPPPASRSDRTARSPFAWDDIWGWAIPKSIAPERKKLAKEMLAADDGRQGRPDEDVQGDRRAAAQHHLLARHRRGRSLHETAEGIGARFAPQGARRLLLRQLAGGAQGVQRHRHQGRHRQARGHRQGAGRGRAQRQQGGAVKA